MAQYFDNFSSDTVDLFPSGWSSEWADMDVSDNYVRASSALSANWAALAGDNYFHLDDTPGVYSRRAAKYIAGDASQISEIRGLVRNATPNDATSRSVAVLCGDGINASWRTGYALWIAGGSNRYRINRKLDGGEDITALAIGSLGAYFDSGSSNSSYFRFQTVASGSNLVIRSKVWSTAVSEPDEWDLSAEDTSPLPAGWQGIGALTNASSAAVGFGWVGIGTDGDPAPTGPVDVSAEPFLLRHNPRLNKVIPVLSSPTVTDIGANCVRPRVKKGY